MRLLPLIVAAVALAGCGDDAQRPPAEPPTRAPERKPRAARTIEPVRCPAPAGNCRAATGRVLYLESRDPDGDGDLHVVLASAQGITAPATTVVDVAPRLRPRNDPRVGDLVAAAGPVYRGSFGQRQIQASAVRFKPRR